MKRRCSASLDVIKDGWPLEHLNRKSECWKYEGEWRFYVNKGDFPLPYESKALSAVYFGCAMPDNQRKKVASLLAEPAPQLYSMVMSKTEFKLEKSRYEG